VEFLVLGPVEARVDGTVVALPRRQQRALLAALVVHAGEVVSTDRLVDDLWGEDPPTSAVGSLQNAVWQLRKALGPDRVVTKAPGYLLAADLETIDARRFERLLTESTRQEPATRAATLREALALWRGPALADVADAPWASNEAARLEALRLTALEERIDAELELGLHGPLVAQLEALVAEHPLSERLALQLGLALYRSGRQADGLEALRGARERLDELGLEPTPELRQLERDILQQSATIARPAPVAPEVAVAELVGERRIVSVLAASLPGEEDPDALRAVLERVLEVANEAVRLHGGELERFGPEGLVAVFGADVSREDDALRAVRAGVELHERAGVAAGVATGDAVLAEEPRVAGAAVARAAGLARAGEGVLLDPRTLELVRESVTFETAGPLARVLAVAATRPEGALDAPLVGRQVELERLRSAFAVARHERRCVMAIVTGEPGIGKTRLARELVDSLDATVLIGRCAAYGEGATFLPLVEALQGVDADLTGDVVVATRIAELGGAEQEPGSLGESYWAVRRLLEALASPRPVVLVLDDVHWAEAALLDLVEYLRDRATDVPLLVLCLARPEILEERPGWAAEALRLEPLAEDETRELVASTAAVEDETLKRIVALAEGNALYAQQLAAYAAESGKALEPGAMPASIEAVLAGRLGRLGADERATLQRAAVVGREFSRGAVAALAPPDLAVDAHLLALTRRGFLHALPDPLSGDDAYRFHHVLLRDAAYATLTKKQRADLHEKVAAWLDRDGRGDDAIVGYHLEQTALLRRDVGRGADELAAAAGERLAAAGSRAWSRNDGWAAFGLLGRAVDLLPPSRQRAAANFELARVLHTRGDDAATSEALDAAIQDAVASRARSIEVRARLEVARLAQLEGQLSPDELIIQAAAAIDALNEEGDHRGLGHAWITMSAAHSFRCEMEAMGEAARRASEHYVEAGWGGQVALGAQAEALFYGPAPVAHGIEQALALLEQATNRPGQAGVGAFLGGLHAMSGDFGKGRRLAADAASVYEDLGSTFSLQTDIAPLQMEIERLAGELDTAVDIGRRSLEVLLEHGAGAHAATRAAQLADIELARGSVEEASRLLEIAVTHALDYDVLIQFMNGAIQARLLARRGDHERAESVAHAAARLAADTDAISDRVRTLVALDEVLCLAGRHDEAREPIRQAERLLLAKGSSAGIARLRDRNADALKA
jgi:DNA-binding SARP family transcriptional activator